MVDKNALRRNISTMEENNFDTKNFKYSSLISSMKSLKPKKIYTPNLNVVRKPRPATSLEKPGEKKKHIDKHDSYKKEKVIQSPEVFWEGTRNFKPHSTNRSRRRQNKKVKMGGLVLSRNRLESPPPSSDSCEECECKDEKLSLEPFELMNNMKQKSPLDLGMKNAEYVSKQSNAFTRTHESSLIVKEEKKLLSSPFGDESNHRQLTVFKLPDYISCKNKTEGISVSNLREGRLGKLLIRRSGKIEARLGKLKCQVDHLDYLPGSADVVNFVHDDNPAGLIVLGNVKNWYSFVPDWNSMVIKR